MSWSNDLAKKCVENGLQPNSLAEDATKLFLKNYKNDSNNENKYIDKLGGCFNQPCNVCVESDRPLRTGDYLELLDSTLKVKAIYKIECNEYGFYIRFIEGYELIEADGFKTLDKMIDSIVEKYMVTRIDYDEEAINVNAGDIIVLDDETEVLIVKSFNEDGYFTVLVKTNCEDYLYTQDSIIYPTIHELLGSYPLDEYPNRRINKRGK